MQQETFGKSGCRRIVPGQTLAADPRGRAVMIGAIEKQKLVYVLNRDAQAKLTISSPLEAHKSHTITFAYAGLDVGFENPVFATLEVDYGDIDQDITGEALRNVQKHLTYYELDLGLNHVVRKLSDNIDNSAHLLITGTWSLLSCVYPPSVSSFSVHSTGRNGGPWRSVGVLSKLAALPQPRPARASRADTSA